MNVILLSGGSGTRLWPLSNDIRSKQFLKIFRLEDGSTESMVQRMVRMIRETNEDAAITIATSQSQVGLIREQLGFGVDISVEPCRRDTFPAIALAAAYLHDVAGKSRDEAAVVCPSDPEVGSGYFQKLSELSDQAQKGSANLALMGIEPDYPSEKYGYIIPESEEKISRVQTFKEKPDEEKAREYIGMGALWNAGVFAFRLGYILDIAEKTLGSSDYRTLYDNYASLTKISFDYAVAEKEKDILVLRYRGKWKDLGSWATLTEAMDETATGNCISADCVNTHVINELQIPLIALGTKDLAIAATSDGILVADKTAADGLKKYVHSARPRYERRLWGEYTVLDHDKKDESEEYSLTKLLMIEEGKNLSYQKHRFREEIWVIEEGEGTVVLDGEFSGVSKGDVVRIKKEVKHSIRAERTLRIIEVQLGNKLVEEDIERFDFSWDRVGEKR